MNKRFGHDIFWAGFIGFLIGILFSFTVWAGNRVIQTKVAIGDDTSTTLVSNALTLTVSDPIDSSTTSDKVIKISGTTSDKSVVLISGGASDSVVDSSGTFNVSYTLQEGPNEIDLTAVSADGRQANVVRNIFYTTETL